jgi:hypothetical protein
MVLEVMETLASVLKDVPTSNKSRERATRNNLRQTTDLFDGH